jgi:hypothetical protein
MVKCPACNHDIPILAMSYACPLCNAGLRLRATYFRALRVVTLLMTGFMGYGAGFRGLTLLVIIALMALPVFVLVVLINVRLFPPDLEATGDYRSILYADRPVKHPSPSKTEPGKMS